MTRRPASPEARERRGRKRAGLDLLARGVDVHARLVRQDEQRALGRVADHLAVDKLGVARDDVGQDRGVHGVRLAGRVTDRSFQAVTSACDLVAVGRIDDLDRRHLVHGQRPGLVGVDRRGEPQRFNRRQVLDDRLLLGELDAAERQDHLDDHRQGQRDGRDRERNRGVEQHLP